MKQPKVVVFDYGSGNVRSALRALEAAGAKAQLSSDRREALAADGLLIPGVGAFKATLEAFKSAGGEQIIDQRLAGGKAVLGICVGMQILFASGDENSLQTKGLGQWDAKVSKLQASVVPHMGWNTVESPANSLLFSGISDERFYFVHSYAVRDWQLNPANQRLKAPLLTHSRHESDSFVAAVEHGALTATQFHPEKSGEAGIKLLQNWLASF